MAFDHENQPTKDQRKPRGKGKRTLMLDAIRETVEGGEKEFLNKVVMIALGQDGGSDSKPNPQLLTLVLQRIEPPLKSTMPLVNFDFNEKADPHEQASQVMKAISNGEISADVGGVFMSSITAMLKIKEVTDLEERIKALEADEDE